MNEVRLPETKSSLRLQDYATGSDFCRIFKEDMKNLYLLALLLTGDSDKAEQCFVAGLDDCASGNQVFQEWARSWARRAVIKNAIRLIAPEGVSADKNSLAGAAGDVGARRVISELPANLAALLDLPPFERFAFVTSVLESYSDRDCALLLGCTREDLKAARSRAMQHIADANDRRSSEQRSLPGPGKSGLELAISTPMFSPA